MPTYEYACDKCGHEFEREQRITEDPVKKCPSCRSSRVRRLISATSFVLKGGGWYSDLYASNKSGSDSGEKSGSEPASDAKATGTDDAKGAAATDTKTKETKSPSTDGGSSPKGKGKKKKAAA